MAVKVFEIDRFGADCERHTQSIAGAVFRSAQLALVGVRSDVLLYHLFVGAETTGGQDDGAPAKLHDFFDPRANDTANSAIFDDQFLSLDPVQIAPTELLK